VFKVVPQNQRRRISCSGPLCFENDVKACQAERPPRVESCTRCDGVLEPVTDSIGSVLKQHRGDVQDRGLLKAVEAAGPQELRLSRRPRIAARQQNKARAEGPTAARRANVEVEAPKEEPDLEQARRGALTTTTARSGTGADLEYKNSDSLDNMHVVRRPTNSILYPRPAALGGETNPDGRNATPEAGRIRAHTKIHGAIAGTTCSLR